ncbi:cytochrome B6 [Schlegelella sp. S2-27]|uniref:Cytochrome B6 n=1 Tax=Caldimonas mangrovi TaxID=2944811 RepID=A0ABT0YIE1_9BURK|nr:cytochrome c peroxidase [Caldimonas mangrovi]MCM5678154.1 cytochrome B6 [Caldimonas mangrovi]
MSVSASRRRVRAFRLAAFVAAVVVVAGVRAADEPISPLPAVERLDPRRVELGRRLFLDKRLSSDRSVACASCHLPRHGGADTRAFSIGAGGVRHVVNTPSVLNARFNFRQQWAGGAATLEELVGHVVKSPRVFATDWPPLLERLSEDKRLVRAFGDAYADGLSARTVVDALATYQRTLVTPSRFDRYLRGEAGAISADELRGYQRFKDYGCVGCHQGVNVGGNMFQRFGVMGDYFKARAAAGQPLTDADRGRYNVTKNDEDLHVFKVPSLRNVARTAPYFHDASAQTLEQAVSVMLRYQVGRDAPAADKALIVRFLQTLDGEVSR